jgi:hypothetical protein
MQGIGDLDPHCLVLRVVLQRPEHIGESVVHVKGEYMVADGGGQHGVKPSKVLGCASHEDVLTALGQTGKSGSIGGAA